MSFITSLKERFSNYPIKTVLTIYGAIIIGFILSYIFQYNQYGIIPREFKLSSFYGIFMSWTMHGNFNHLCNNLVASVPLLLIFFFNEKNYKHAMSILFSLTIGTGVFVWLFGGHASHIGASGVIFSLIGFILVSSLIRKQFIYLIFVFLTFGSLSYSLTTGLIPTGSYSFSAHFGGFLVGVYTAIHVSTMKNKFYQLCGKILKRK